MNWNKPICLSFFKAAYLKRSRAAYQEVKPPFILEVLEPKILLSAELVGGMVDGNTFTSFDNEGAEQYNSQVEFDRWADELVNQNDNTSAVDITPSVTSKSDLSLDNLAEFFANQQAQNDEVFCSVCF